MLALPLPFCCFFFNDTATTEIYTLSLHDALPIFREARQLRRRRILELCVRRRPEAERSDRKSTRLNSSHMSISYAVFCLKKRKIYPNGAYDVLVSYDYNQGPGNETSVSFVFSFFNDTATTEIYPLSLHDALPICRRRGEFQPRPGRAHARQPAQAGPRHADETDRKSTRLNSSPVEISYAVFC